MSAYCPQGDPEFMPTPPGVDAALVGSPVRIRVLRSEVIRTGTGRSNQRPYTLYRLTATLTNVEATPIEGELRTFDGFDGAEYTVTIEPYANEPGVFTVKKVRDAASVSASRSQARRKLVGETPTPAGRPPSRSELEALTERVTQLEARLQVVLDIVNSQ